MPTTPLSRPRTANAHILRSRIPFTPPCIDLDTTSECSTYGITGVHCSMSDAPDMGLILVVSQPRRRRSIHRSVRLLPSRRSPRILSLSNAGPTRSLALFPCRSGPKRCLAPVPLPVRDAHCPCLPLPLERECTHRVEWHLLLHLLPFPILPVSASASPSLVDINLLHSPSWPACLSLDHSPVD